MLTGFHAGVSGLYYNEQKLAVTSHNMANVDTGGFRNAYLMFRTREQNPSHQRIDPTIEERLPSSYGVERSGVFHNYEQSGEIKETGNPMDVSIPPELKNAFFAVRRTDPTDPNVYFTRNGQLNIGPQDPTNPNSPSVLYVAGHVALDGGMQPIFVDESQGPLTIGRDGEIKQGEGAVGVLGVHRLDANKDPNTAQSANLQDLVQLGDSLFKVPEQGKNQFYPHPIEVGRAGVHRTVLQGMRERSNVNIFHELVDMMNTTQSFHANRSAMAKQIDGLTKLFQIVQK